MKQVTGSSTSLPNIEVSIQLALDGHSFSVRGLDTTAAGPVTAEILTPRTTLVPEAFAAPRNASEWLATAGLAPLADEITVCSAPQEGLVAVMALPAAALRQVQERFGQQLRFTTPLLDAPASRRRSVLLRLQAGLLYIKVYDDTLRFAEVIPAPTEADTLALIERLGAEFPLREYDLHLAGGEAKSLRRLLGKRFGKVSCE